MQGGGRKKFFDPYPYDITDVRNQRLANYRLRFDSISIRNSNQWKEIQKEISAFIVGSDIVWQPTGGYPTQYFLDFAYYTSIPKFSYGTSIGATKLPKKYFKAYQKYLGAFSAISVREKSAAALLEPILNRKIESVLDPTLLLPSEEWDVYAKQAVFSVQIEKKFILCYFVMRDARYWEYVKKVSEVTNLQIVVLPMHDLDEQQPYTVIMDGTPYEFVWLIKNASFICTDSFHACAFSLNYKKEFYLLRRSRKDEDDKYDDFLSRYGLEGRSIRDESVFVRNSNIDFESAHRRLAEDREMSCRYLDKALQGRKMP